MLFGNITILQSENSWSISNLDYGSLPDIILNSAATNITYFIIHDHKCTCNCAISQHTRKFASFIVCSAPTHLIYIIYYISVGSPVRRIIIEPQNERSGSHHDEYRALVQYSRIYQHLSNVDGKSRLLLVILVNGRLLSLNIGLNVFYYMFMVSRPSFSSLYYA